MQSQPELQTNAKKPEVSAPKYVNNGNHLNENVPCNSEVDSNLNKKKRRRTPSAAKKNTPKRLRNELEWIKTKAKILRYMGKEQIAAGKSTKNSARKKSKNPMGIHVNSCVVIKSTDLQDKPFSMNIII